MKKFLFLLVLFGSLHSFAEATPDDGLPYEPDTTIVKLNKISKGASIKLEFILTLPATQKLNKGASSSLAVYEKRKKEKKWIQTEQWDLNTVASFDDQLHFTKNIQLQHPDSEVAVFSTIFHCGKKAKTACYIQGFKGIASRSSAQAPSTIPFYIEGKMR